MYTTCSYFQPHTHIPTYPTAQQNPHRANPSGVHSNPAVVPPPARPVRHSPLYRGTMSRLHVHSHSSSQFDGTIGTRLWKCYRFDFMRAPLDAEVHILHVAQRLEELAARGILLRRDSSGRWTPPIGHSTAFDPHRLHPASKVHPLRRGELLLYSTLMSVILV